jgi:hypothetical protein
VGSERTPADTSRPTTATLERGVVTRSPPGLLAAVSSVSSGIAVTANVYSHVLTDETELDYARMLG